MISEINKLEDDIIRYYGEVHQNHYRRIIKKRPIRSESIDSLKERALALSKKIVSVNDESLSRKMTILLGHFYPDKYCEEKKRALLTEVVAKSKKLLEKKMIFIDEKEITMIRSKLNEHFFGVDAQKYFFREATTFVDYLDSTSVTFVKNELPCCIPIDCNTDIRIILNNKSGFRAISQCFHEYGHAIYYAHQRNLEKINWFHPDPIYSEIMAVFFQDIFLLSNDTKIRKMYNKMLAYEAIAIVEGGDPRKNHYLFELAVKYQIIENKRLDSKEKIYQFLKECCYQIGRNDNWCDHIEKLCNGCIDPNYFFKAIGIGLPVDPLSN